MTSPAQSTDPIERLSDLSQQALEARAAARNATRVLVQWGHCSQAVGADLIYRRLDEALAGQSDVSLVATGCDGACFAATQVVVQRPDGAAHYFDHLGPDDDLAGVLAAIRGVADAGTSHPSPELEAFFNHQHLAVTEGLGNIDPRSLDEYVAGGGYNGLAAALSLSPDAICALALEAGLLGRGGAFFPAARKWQAARSVNARRRHVVVNAEEGEPGVFKDRHLMEGNPHRIIEGALIAAHAAGADSVVIYVNAEANLSAERMTRAVADAAAANLIGDNILGSRLGMRGNRPARRGRLRLRRGNHPAEHHRGPAEGAQAAAAVPHRCRTVRRTHRHQQCRNPLQRTGHPDRRRAPVRLRWPERCPRHPPGIADRCGASPRNGRGSHGNHGAPGH